MADQGEVLTQAQKDALEAELEELEGPRRAAVVEAIATAQRLGLLAPQALGPQPTE